MHPKQPDLLSNSANPSMYAILRNIFLAWDTDSIYSVSKHDKPQLEAKHDPRVCRYNCLGRKSTHLDKVMLSDLGTAIGGVGKTHG